MRFCLTSGIFLQPPVDMKGMSLKDGETSVTALELMDSSQIDRAKDVSNLSSRPIRNEVVHQEEFINL